jgi:hypothetical protein
MRPDGACIEVFRQVNVNQPRLTVDARAYPHRPIKFVFAAIQVLDLPYDGHLAVGVSRCQVGGAFGEH